MAWEYPPSFPKGRNLSRARATAGDDILGRAGFNGSSLSRTARRGTGGAVLRRDAAPGRVRAVLTWKPGHQFFEPHCIWQSLAPVFMRQSTGALGRISCVLYVIVDPDPEVDSPFALENLYIISTSPLYLAASRPGYVSRRRQL